jgi:hypothetical protein
MNETQIREIAQEVGLSQITQNNWELLAKFAELYFEKQYVQRGYITPGTVYSILRRPDFKKASLHKQATNLARYPAYFKRSDFKKTFPKEAFE